MTEALREKLIKLNLDSKTLSRLEGFDDDVIERNLQLALERQPASLAGFLVRACREDWAAQAAYTPRVAPTPLQKKLMQLKRERREFMLERAIILDTPHVLSERFGGGHWPLTDEERQRLVILDAAIAQLEKDIAALKQQDHECVRS